MPIGAPHLKPDDCPPAFGVGDLVVHPHHGAGRIAGLGRRRLGDSERSYLEIELVDGALRIMVPCESAAAVGLRAVVSPQRLKRIVKVLESAPETSPGNWAARERQHRERLKSGDVLELAAVIRDLASRAGESALSGKEAELYERTRGLLASELRYALGFDAEHARAYIDGHVSPAAPPRPTRRTSRNEVRKRRTSRLSTSNS